MEISAYEPFIRERLEPESPGRDNPEKLMYYGI
jgi:hypothetical protein